MLLLEGESLRFDLRSITNSIACYCMSNAPGSTRYNSRRNINMGDNKISVHSLNDLKNTTDDCLGNYLRSLNFTQDNSKLDVRLAVGYTAVVIAAVTFVADYKLGWEATKTGTALAVAAYAILNAVYTYWMWLVEKGLVFEGERQGKKVGISESIGQSPSAGSTDNPRPTQISIASRTKKHDPTYYIAVTAPASTKALELSCPFTTWFTADGYFVAQPFQQWLASSIDVVAEADQKNSVKSEKEDAFVSQQELNGMASSTGSSTQPGRTPKKSKRKG